MSGQIEHFVYGTREQLERFSADLTNGIEVALVPDGLLPREVSGDKEDPDAAIERLEACALGVTDDGHGQFLNDAIGDDSETLERDLQLQTFTARTGIEAGHSFGFPLSDGRISHAVHVGSDRRGYLLLDITALVADGPADAEALREAPRRYRQPILVWHTPFAAVPLTGTSQFAQIPCEATFPSGIGWPDPLAVARLERQYGITATDCPKGWNALLLAMAQSGERLPGLKLYSIWTALVGRSGLLKLIEDHATRPFSPGGNLPMPWQPTDMEEITAILAGAPDMIAFRDKVT
jgi:hypothetical protein